MLSPSFSGKTPIPPKIPFFSSKSGGGSGGPSSTQSPRGAGGHPMQSTAGPVSLLHKPFISSRTNLINKIQRETNEEQNLYLPGVQIPIKPQNVPKAGEKRGEGLIRGPKKKIRRLIKTQHEPLQIIPMDDYVYSVHTVKHELAKEIIAVRFATKVEIHALRLRTVENDEFFTTEKLQECSVGEDDLIESLSVSCSSSIGYGARKLIYAFALFNRAEVFVVVDEPMAVLPFQPIIKVEDEAWVSSYIEHCNPVTIIKFDGEQGRLVASLSKDPYCKIWDVKEKKLFGTLLLDTFAVDVIFHQSEPQKILIAERSGWVKFYSLISFTVIYSINTGPMLSVDWSHLDPLAVATGHGNCIRIFSIDELNSEPNRSVDSNGANMMLRLSTADRFTFATLSRSKNDLKVFHANMKTPLWCERKEQLQWIEWVYGKPYIMACVGETIQFFEASLY